jgi:DNA-binding NtrC family response regulator
VHPRRIHRGLQSDELLEQLGQSLDGESAIRQADTVDALARMIRAAQPCVVLLDVRSHASPSLVIEQLGAGRAFVIVVFAAADQTATVAGSIRSSAVFAVLPVPLEIAKTAAVLEGAREEALSRRTSSRSPIRQPRARPECYRACTGRAPRCRDNATRRCLDRAGRDRGGDCAVCEAGFETPGADRRGWSRGARRGRGGRCVVRTAQ